MKYLIVAVCVSLLACSSSPVRPSEAPSASNDAPIFAQGPSGCVDASTLPDVVRWALVGVPAHAYVEKAYSFDQHVNCEPTERNLRTQNDHLRVTLTPPTGLVEFDLRDTFFCRGRLQVDVRINGVLVVAVVITRSTAPFCPDPVAPIPDPVPVPRPDPDPEPIPKLPDPLPAPKPEPTPMPCVLAGTHPHPCEPVPPPCPKTGSCP